MTLEEKIKELRIKYEEDNEVNISNPRDYIILPGRRHGNYEYPNLLVSADKGYIGNWEYAQSFLNKNKFFMLNLRQFVDFLNLLKSGSTFFNAKPVYNGCGNKIDKTKVSSLYNYLTESSSSAYQGEFLDNEIKTLNGKQEMRYNHRLKEGKIFPLNVEPFEKCLTKGKPFLEFLGNNTTGIHLESWLENANSQGMPKENTESGFLHFYPEDGYAHFGRGGIPACTCLGFSYSFFNNNLYVRPAALYKK